MGGLLSSLFSGRFYVKSVSCLPMSHATYLSIESKSGGPRCYLFSIDLGLFPVPSVLPSLGLAG